MNHEREELTSSDGQWRMSGPQAIRQGRGVEIALKVMELDNLVGCLSFPELGVSDTCRVSHYEMRTNLARIGLDTSEILRVSQHRWICSAVFVLGMGRKMMQQAINLGSASTRKDESTLEKPMVEFRGTRL